VRSLVRDLRARGVTVAVAQAHYDPRFAIASLRIPTAVVLHDPRPHSGEERTLPRRGRIVARLVEATASAIVIHSARLEPQVRSFLRGHPLAVVPHGAYVASQPAPPPQTPQLLLFGRLFPYKGIDIAIEAMKLVRSQRPDCCLFIAGDGPMGASLREALPEGVTLHDGYVTEHELDVLLGRATLVLLPYRDATQSGVGLRAVAAGVPCIVTGEGGLPDLVPPNLPSYVVPSGDARALAEAILEHLDHDELDRRAFHEHASQMFDWPVVGKQMVSELRRLNLIASDRVDL
jgi:glycosyltransferase involved in cell wall biosynthesis